MAEKYGVVPKLFTKKWWEYFWDYYKYHTIAVLAILFIGGISVYQAVTEPQYDFNIAYSADIGIPEESVEPLRQRLSDFSVSPIGDGVCINQNTFIEGSGDAEMEYAMVTRMQLEMTDKKTILYMFDENKSTYFIGVPEMEGAFKPVSEWLSEDASQYEVMEHNGVGYAVKLNNSELLKEFGVVTDNLYIAMRNYNEEDAEKLGQKIAFATNVANAIVK